MYIGIDGRLIDLSLCCIICSQIKKDKGFGCQTRTTDILSLERAAVHCVSPPRQHPRLENSLNLAGCGFERTAQHHDREWLSALLKNRRVRGDFVNSAVCGLYC